MPRTLRSADVFARGRTPAPGHLHRDTCTLAYRTYRQGQPPERSGAVPGEARAPVGRRITDRPTRPAGCLGRSIAPRGRTPALGTDWCGSAAAGWLPVRSRASQALRVLSTRPGRSDGRCPSPKDVDHSATRREVAEGQRFDEQERSFVCKRDTEPAKGRTMQSAQRQAELLSAFSNLGDDALLSGASCHQPLT